MTPDELVSEIFRIQNERNPDADAGDLMIDIQDDMALVSVHQWTDAAEGTTLIGFAGSIQRALEDALANVQAKI